MKNRILPLISDTLDVIRLKHSKPKNAHKSVMFPNISDRMHPAKIKMINEKMIKKTALKTKRKSSSSGLNAGCWKLFSKNFGESSSDLCQTLTSRGGPRAAATSKMERFMIIVNGFQQSICTSSP